MIKESIIILIFISSSLSWLPTGHYLTALIAEKEIERQNPELMTKLTDLLSVFSKYTKEDEHVFVESASFPDDIKYLEWKSFNKWHFYNQFLIKTKNPGKVTKDSRNIIWAIYQSVRTLSNENKTNLDQRFAKSFMLRYFIHLVGDVHQPLHSCVQVDDDNKKGDAGGNGFKIKVSGADSLHKLWDKTLKMYKEVKGPLNDKEWSYLNEVADDLMKKNPINKKSIK